MRPYTDVKLSLYFLFYCLKQFTIQLVNPLDYQCLKYLQMVLALANSVDTYQTAHSLIKAYSITEIVDILEQYSIKFG